MTDVDELIESTSLELVLLHYGLPLPQDHAKEHRMTCVFSEACIDSQYGQLTVQADAAKRIYCHTCTTRGNLLTLIHGLEHRSPPDGGKLRGQQFREAVGKLREIADSPAESNAIPPEIDIRRIQPRGLPPSLRPAAGAAETESPRKETPVNPPLKRHPKEAAQTLADLYKDLVTDVAEMSPQAAQYVRSRPWMTPELMQKWGVGWIPGDGRSLFRKNYLVYTHRNERGEVISYSGRNLSFEEQHARWVRDGKPEGKKPVKHRYVSGFHRGVELYGGHATRMLEPYIRESLQQHGLVIVEGQNDVIRMDELQVAAVGLCSNKATETQIANITRHARTAGNNRVLLLPDCDEEGEAGFKELLWRINEQRLDVRLGLSSLMSGGNFAGRQPEHLTEAEWQVVYESTPT